MASPTPARRGSWWWWLAIPFLCALSIIPAFIFLELSPGLERIFLGALGILDLNSSLGVWLSLGQLAVVFAALTIWLLPSFLLAAYALRGTNAVRWGLSVCLLVTALYLWFARPSSLLVAHKVAAVSAAVVVAAGALVSVLQSRLRRGHAIALILGGVTLMMPASIALLIAPSAPPLAKKVWTVSLAASSWPDMNTQSELSARHQVVFSGNRLVVSYEVGPLFYQGTQTMDNYRLISVDLRDGRILASRTSIGHSADTPLLFATQAGTLY